MTKWIPTGAMAFSLIATPATQAADVDDKATARAK